MWTPPPPLVSPEALWFMIINCLFYFTFKGSRTFHLNYGDGKRQHPLIFFFWEVSRLGVHRPHRNWGFQGGVFPSLPTSTVEVNRGDGTLWEIIHPA